MFKMIKELWTYRSMIESLVRRELRGKYAASFLGFLWTFMNPLLQLIVYTIVFTVIFHNSIERYYLYLFIGLVPWMYFSSVFTEGANCVVHQSSLVKRIYFPRMVLPIAFSTSRFINMLLVFIVIFLVIIVTGWEIDLVALLFLPIVFAVEYLLVTGIAMFVSCLTVYFRDLAYILGVISTLWMYATPLFYSPDIIPEAYRMYYNLNPMVSIITAYRDILYDRHIPALETLILATVLGLLVLTIGALLFTILNRRFAEEL